MADRELLTDPPQDGYRQVGRYCVYHEGPEGGYQCHNPLDCDFTPMWALARLRFNQELAGHRGRVDYRTPAK